MADETLSRNENHEEEIHTYLYAHIDYLQINYDHLGNTSVTVNSSLEICSYFK